MAKKTGASTGAKDLKGCVSYVGALDTTGDIHFCVQTVVADVRRERIANFVAAAVLAGTAKLQREGKTVATEGEEINADHSMGEGSSTHFRTFAYAVRVKKGASGAENTLVGYVIGRLLAEGYVTPEVIRESERNSANRLSGLPIVRDMIGQVSDVPASMLKDTVGRVVKGAEVASRPAAPERSAGS